jgi:hypothetical protein
MNACRFLPDFLGTAMRMRCSRCGATHDHRDEHVCATVTDSRPAVTDITPEVTDTVTDRSSAAEKQWRYRQRHLERVREMDRERKRRARS